MRKNEFELGPIPETAIQTPLDNDLKSEGENPAEQDDKDQEEEYRLYSMAMAKANGVVSGWENKFKVSVTHAHIDNTVESCSYDSLVLKFDCSDKPEFSWTMEIGLSEDYINNELPNVLEKIRQEQLNNSQETANDDKKEAGRNESVLSKRFFERERAITEKEAKALKLADELTNEVLSKLGLDEINLPTDKIHMIDGPVGEHEEDALFNSASGEIAISQQPRLIIVAKKAIHEIFHAKTHMKVARSNTGQEYEKQFGLATAHREGEMPLDWMNEALVEELTLRLVMERLQSNEMFVNEVSNSILLRAKNSDMYTSDGKQLFGPETYCAYGNPDGSIATDNFTYTKERETLVILIDKIYKRNSGRFETKDQVFNFFAASMFTGNLENIQNLVDDTFGEGTFDRMGRENADVDSQKAFVESLR